MVVLESRTGKTRWHLPSPGAKDRFNAVGIGADVVVGARVRCSGASTPRVEAYDLESGERRWSRKTFGFPITEARMLSVPRDQDIAAGGVIVTTAIAPAPEVAGLAVETGKVRWRIGLPETFVGVTDDLVFTRRVDSEPRNVLQAFDRRTGEERWTFPVTEETGHTDMATVAGNADTVVVVSGPPNSGGAPNPLGPTTLLVIDASTGKERVRFTAENPNTSFSDFAIIDGALVFAEQADVVARDLTDGSVRWRHPTGARLPPQLAGNAVLRIMLSSDGRTVFTDSYDQRLEILDAATGAVRWTEPSRTLFFERADDATAVMQPAQEAEPGSGQSDRRLTARTNDRGKEQWTATVEDVLDTRLPVEFDVHAREGTALVAMRCPDD